MITILAILLVTAFIAFVELPTLWRRGERREIWTFILLLLLGSAMNIMSALNIPIPNPVIWIQDIYQPLVDWSKQFFPQP